MSEPESTKLTADAQEGLFKAAGMLGRQDAKDGRPDRGNVVFIVTENRNNYHREYWNEERRIRMAAGRPPATSPQADGDQRDPYAETDWAAVHEKVTNPHAEVVESHEAALEVDRKKIEKLEDEVERLGEVEERRDKQIETILSTLNQHYASIQAALGRTKEWEETTVP